MRYWISLFSICLIPGTADAYRMYKCVDDDGGFIYTQTRCLEGPVERVRLEPASGYDAPESSRSLTERAKYRNRINASRNAYRPRGRVMSLSPSGGSGSTCNYYRNEMARAYSAYRSGYSGNQGANLSKQLSDMRKRARKACN